MPVLAFGAFATGMDAYVMAGLLGGIGQDLGVSVSRAGQCVTVFTVCYAVSAPVLSAALARFPARAVLVSALLVFTLANAGSALAGTYPLLLVCRAVAGAGAGLFSPNAATAAAALVPADRRGRALSVVLGGMSGGTVLGVPLGLLLAEDRGWRTALWMVTALGAAACLAVATLLPRIRTGPAPTLRARLRPLGHARVALVVGMTFFQTVASLGLYTYLQPVLHATAGIDRPTVPLWVWGLGGVCGSLLAGALADRFGRPALLSAVLLATLGGTLAALPWTGAVPGLVLLPLLLWGAVGWAFVVPQQHRLIEADAPGGAAVALNSSATYLGGSVGSALGGVALAAGAGARWLPLGAAAIAAAGLLPYLLARRPAASGPRDLDRFSISTKGTSHEDRCESSELRP
ncbi:MFS transporter [Streptomyces sp. NBC_01335]|uniref:MFS transporter n=1 Tax=Streptomyces sp. NBC_01335 TaxID=2903828 RepID=UPI002E1558FD|nr:MFS transporter [Streptomyces sp. NBC_01335]